MPARRSRRRLPDEVQQGALEQPVQALPARVDDAGLAQDRQQGRRPCDRLLGGVERRGQDRLDVVVALRRDDRRVGRLADDRQDRALDRLGDRAVGRLRALRQGVGEVEAVEPALAAETLGHAAEDLARDHPGVAAGAHQRPEADRRRDPFGRLTGDALRLVERGLDRRQHVRAGVAVGDGIDVERVDLVDVGLEVGDRRPEGAEQSVAVAGAAGHQATSVPLSARSRGPTASWVRGWPVGRRSRRARTGGRRRGSSAGRPRGRGRGGSRSGPPNRPGARPRRPGTPKATVRSRSTSIVSPRRTSMPGLGEPEPRQQRARAAGRRTRSRRTSRASPLARCRSRPDGSRAIGRASAGSARGRGPPRRDARSGVVEAGRREAVCYSTAPFGPLRASTTSISTIRGPRMARSCAICGKVSMGGFNPQSSGMNRVRAHRRMKPNLQPLVIDVKGTADQVARLHPLPAHAAEVGQVTRRRRSRRSNRQTDPTRPVAQATGSSCVPGLSRLVSTVVDRAGRGRRRAARRRRGPRPRRR